MDQSKIVHVVLEARNDNEGDDHIIVLGVWENERDIPPMSEGAKLYGPAFKRNVVHIFLNCNQAAPGFGIGKHRPT